MSVGEKKDGTGGLLTMPTFPSRWLHNLFPVFYRKSRIREMLTRAVLVFKYTYPMDRNQEDRKENIDMLSKSVVLMTHFFLCFYVNNLLHLIQFEAPGLFPIMV